MVDTLLLIMILIYFDIISDSQPCEFSSTSRSPFPVSAAYGMSHAEAHRLADQRGGVGSTGRSLDAAGVLGTFGQGPWAVGTCKRGFRQTHHSARGRRHVPFCEWGSHDWPDEKNLMKKLYIFSIATARSAKRVGEEMFSRWIHHIGSIAV